MIYKAARFERASFCLRKRGCLLSASAVLHQVGKALGIVHGNNIRGSEGISTVFVVTFSVLLSEQAGLLVAGGTIVNVPRGLGASVYVVHELVRVFNVQEVIVLNQNRGVRAKADAVAVTGRVEEVVVDVSLTIHDARYALVNVLGPPVVMVSNVKFVLVFRLGTAARADQACKTVVAACIRVVELAPRDIDKVRFHSNVEESIGGVVGQ